MFNLALIGALALPALAANQLPRQASAASPPASPAAATSSAALPPPSYSPLSSAGPAAPPPSSVSWSFLSTNPTALPLSDIVSGTITTQATLPLTTTYQAGAQPTFVSNAPPLPNLATILPSNYPALDKLPPTDSPEVQQWILEVNQSGIVIPDIPVTQPGGCAANAAAAADTSRCWWTCGGCVRPTDITTCPDKLTWGLTYDDGPAFYTPNLLQYLNQNALKTTFFVVGSRAISYPALLQEEYMAGHQLAAHTWSHPSMTTVSTEGLIAELGWSKKIIKDVTGVTPVYFRPPYGDIDDRVRAIVQAMGLIPVIWTRISPEATFDTGDYNVAGGTVSAPQVLQNWQFIMGNVTSIDTGFIVLEHDLFAQTVDLATGYILPDALAFTPKLNIMPVIQCLNKPFGDAYVETNDNSSNPLPVTSVPGGSSAGGSGSGKGGAQATGGANGTSSGSGSGAAKTGGAAALEVRPTLLVAAGTAVFGLLAFFSTLA